MMAEQHIGQELGKYRLLRLLGKGGSSEVYLGEHKSLGTQAAIKVLYTQLEEKESVHRFLTEARIVASLDHPHIIRIFDFDVQAGTPFIVMDYAANGNLRQRFPKGKILPLPTILVCVRQIAAALQYAHDQKLIHRDMKPENMLLGRRNELLLSDFGIALISQGSTFQTQQEVAGTLAYMAPEQFQGKPRPASDQYSLAITVYEWFTGERPFQGSFTEMANHHIFTPPPPLHEKAPGISPAIEEVVMTALAKDPHRRFPSVMTFANALEQACLPYLSLSQPPPIVPITGFPPSITGETERTLLQTPDGIRPSVSNIDHAVLPTSHPSLPVAPPVPSSLNQAEPIQQQLGSAEQSPYPAYQIPPPPSPQIDSGKPPRRGRSFLHGRALLLLALVLLIVAASALTSFLLLNQSNKNKSQATVTAPISHPGVGVTLLADGQSLGLSDGSFAFDTNRPDGSIKIDAANKFRGNDTNSATVEWQLAAKEESNDAEALIYLEDLRVVTSGHPYITFVVGTFLYAKSVGFWANNLQGAYVAQKEFNEKQQLPGGVLVRLLLANSGNPASDSNLATIAKQIVQAAQADPSIVGVMGWPFSEQSKKTAEVLAAAHLPLMSAGASNDFLTGISSYFFRIVPTDNSQAVAGAHYAEQVLHAKRAAIFFDPNDIYTLNLANDFKQRFIADGNSVVALETYPAEQSASLSVQVQNALQANPDVIYFAGYSDDAASLLAALPPAGPLAQVQVIGGESLAASYPGNVAANTRLHFTSFAYYDEWSALNHAAQQPAFFSEYLQAFDPSRQHKGNPEGFTRPTTNAMLSYDAMLSLLSGAQLALGGGKTRITSSELQQGLGKLTGPRAIQGATGAISFGSDGNPANKLVILLSLQANGIDVKVAYSEGSLLKAIA